MMNSYGKFDEYVKLAANNTEKAAKIVAKSFYKILRKNGFDDAQIVNVANNILDCLIHSLEGYEQKKKTKGVPTYRPKVR
jgi:hypothetical protein